jgi:hypothetical protein
MLSHGASTSLVKASDTRHSTHRLERPALLVIVSHAVLVAATHWLLYQQFLGRAMPDLRAPLAAAFRGYTARTFAIELIALVAAGAAVAGIRLLAGLRHDHQPANAGPVATTGLISYVPVALFWLGAVVALTFGWEPEVWILSATDATDAQVSSAIQEALPIVLQPLVIGRQVATIAAAVTFAVLQRRLCGVGTGEAMLAAAAAGVSAIGVHMVMLGVPWG